VNITEVKMLIGVPEMGVVHGPFLRVDVVGISEAPPLRLQAHPHEPNSSEELREPWPGPFVVPLPPHQLELPILHGDRVSNAAPVRTRRVFFAPCQTCATPPRARTVGSPPSRIDG